MRAVGVRELRQNLSRYLQAVKAGEALVVTEHGREVARLVPSGPADDPLARLAANRGATLPTGSLCDVGAGLPPAGGPPSGDVIDRQREERL
ncbi:MAG TPA: type II toxin-antitoxin system prevent-host-death family antitoxin [Solirubrobacteraceae bacterium]|jgi:prevent-host-death family protein|nr:type II toxin-antitoxin system prevent-host-death family antitoxin [Solirubrobacteraceae bacterium]